MNQWTAQTDNLNLKSFPQQSLYDDKENKQKCDTVQIQHLRTQTQKHKFQVDTKTE